MNDSEIPRGPAQLPDQLQADPSDADVHMEEADDEDMGTGGQYAEVGNAAEEGVEPAAEELEVTGGGARWYEPVHPNYQVFDAYRCRLNKPSAVSCLCPNLSYLMKGT